MSEKKSKPNDVEIDNDCFKATNCFKFNVYK